MEISEIKTQLTIAHVLQHYHLKPDKSLRLCCPFHEDKTPSLQVYYKTQTCYCFAASCKTHGKSIDVIDFVMYKEGLSKADAINKCKELIGGPQGNRAERFNENQSRETFLANMFQYFRNAMHNSQPAKDYVQIRGLDFKKVEIGYNAGQFHHGARKDERLIQTCVNYGLLIDKDILGRTGEKAYGVFGKWCICFALRNGDNQVVSMYFRSTLNDEKARHFYLKERQGLYPSYPKKNTKKLILTESIIDAATLLQIEEISKNYSILASYGTNGLTKEHTEAIKNLAELEEVIFAFDNDEAGRAAVKTYGELLQNEYKQLKISTVELPCKDINETLIAHEPAVFKALLDDRKELNASFFSNEKEKGQTKTTTEKTTQNPENKEITEPKTSTNGDVIDFLKRKTLLHNLNLQIGKAGIVGEEQARMLLFLIIVSYVNKQPLHALVQGSSGSGKTHLISRIADLMPPEDVLRFTRITESSLYNWGEYDLFEKVIIIEDLDGLKEDALYALREFISNQVLRSSVTIKDKKGNNKSSHKIVKGQFSSLSATTKGESYEDNMSRSFLIAVDESQAQTQKIIGYQNQRNAGEIDGSETQKAVAFIQKMVRALKHYEIINPYATQLFLPEKVHKIRRLNEMYQAVIKQVTFINQYQRKTTPAGQLIAEIEDIEQATEILFESIVLKVDELDGSLRQFFERLKKYVKSENQDFILREVRQALGVSKTQMFRYIQNLVELEYLKTIGGHPNTGLKYKISYWDNYQKLRAEIKDYLMNQIEALKAKNSPTKPQSKNLSTIVKEQKMALP
jgi:DNA primase